MDQLCQNLWKLMQSDGLLFMFDGIQNRPSKLGCIAGYSMFSTYRAAIILFNNTPNFLETRFNLNINQDPM